jgi:dihydroneopterin aldolase
MVAFNWSGTFGMSFAPDAAAGLRLVFVRHLEVQALLGVYAHEETRPQRVILDVELAVEDAEAPLGEGPDRLARVVDYAAVADTARRIATSAHVRLAETLAERIAISLLEDSRIRRARVGVTKPDALPGSIEVGVVIERSRF